MDEKLAAAYAALKRAMDASRELTAALDGIDYIEVANEIALGDGNVTFIRLARKVVETADEFGIG